MVSATDSGGFVGREEPLDLVHGIALLLLLRGNQLPEFVDLASHVDVGRRLGSFLLPRR